MVDFTIIELLDSLIYKAYNAVFLFVERWIGNCPQE